MKTILLFLFSFSTITMWTQIIVPVPENKNSAEPKPSKALERSSEDVDFVEKKKIATEFNAANSQQLNYNQAYAYFNQKWNQFSRNPNRRTFSANEQQELQIYLGRMTQLEEKNPRSLLSYYLAGQHNTERYEALRLAEKSLPNDADVLKQLVAFNEIVGKFENERELLVRIFRLSIYPKTNIDYAQDVLASVANGGILVVHGWEDFLA
ncbi:MAG: hypothetical protein KJ941_12725, partial [Bacteroidetes bacterium]|nr:hypothetical protein [Bacteroidota bacterium]